MNTKRKLLAILLFTASVPVATGQEVPVELPQGFSIKKVAGNDLVPDASAMTIDQDGHPIVSGPGYVRRLLDENSDGVFDGFETLAETKGIAQGIWIDGKEMWLTVDGAIRRSVSKEDGKPFVFENVVSITTDAEHGSHAIRRSADGKWWYVICGNATKIRDEYFSLPDSPIKKPRAGFLMRFPVDVGTGDKFAAEIVCHGFRNAYDFDFGRDGKVFVYDSDGERDVSLPWYRPTRVFEMKPGDDAGWVSRSWKRPASFYDMPKLVGELGRGSPTGVAVCDSNKFGNIRERAVFVGDWTFGRIAVAGRGIGVEVFAKPKGNFGFAVTDLEFSNDGSLFVTTGGRGTEGSLYRIQKTGEILDADPYHFKQLDEAEKLQKKFIEDSVRKALEETKDRHVEDIVRDEEENKFVNELKSSAANPLMIRKLQLRLGGCNGNGMFGGHRAVNPETFSDEDRKLISENLRIKLNQGEEYEVARLIGMLHLKDQSLTNVLSDVAVKMKDPVERIHYLNCVAAEGGKLYDDMVPHVANALLRIRREIDAAKLPVDRNWKPMMQQLANELFRDMRIPEAMVKDASFGQPSDIWIFDSLPEIFRTLARTKIAAKLKANPDDATREQLRAVSGGAKFKDVVRSFSDRGEFTDVIVHAIHAKPTTEDWDVLVRGLRSFNLNVNKASAIGLRKVDDGELYLARREKAMGKLFKLEKRLGWTNPEVSVRDQIVMALHKWNPKRFDYKFRQYDLSPDSIEQQKLAVSNLFSFLATEHPLSGIDNEKEATDQVQRLRNAKIDFSTGDSLRGKAAYKKFQCATCHDGGGQNSGPSLAGIASRFSRDDVLKAIVDPNDNVPDRYRAMIVATEDGQLFQGSVVYESKAGIMLATNTGEIVRVDADNIERKRRSNKSLMPEGLLDEASDQEIADLWSYLSQLK